MDYFDINWPNILKLDEKNVNSATNNFLDTINYVLSKYVPLKKVNKYKLRFKKPWITSALQKSVYIKNKLLKKFIYKKDPQIKDFFHEQYKTYRNLLSTLMKHSKQIYCTKNFGNNWNNIKNTWKGIKTTISIKKITTTVSHPTEFNTNPLQIL